MKGERAIYVPPNRRNVGPNSPPAYFSVSNEIISTEDSRVDKSPPRVKERTIEKNKEKEPSRSERGFYIPPARRGKADYSVEDTQTATNTNQDIVIKDDWESEIPLKTSSHEKLAEAEETYISPDWTELDHEFKDYIRDEKLNSCCLIIDNFPSDASDITRENEIKPYARYGCDWKWITRRQCLIVFLNESALNRAITAYSTSLYRPVTLEKFQSKNLDPYLYEVARQLYSQLKPERDSKVANRLINHALGIRPLRKPKGPPKVIEIQKSEDTTRDAWDD